MTLGRLEVEPVSVLKAAVLAATDPFLLVLPASQIPVEWDFGVPGSPSAAVSWVCLPFLWFAAPQAGTDTAAGGCRSSLCLLHPCCPNSWIL